MFKTAIFFIALILFVSCSRSAGPSNVNQSQSPKTVDQRGGLPPDKAMLGQWQSSTKKCYVSTDKIIWQDLPNGDREAWKYKIERVNDTNRTVIFKYSDAKSSLQNTLKFAADNLSFQHILEYAEDKPETFNYVDSKQEP